MYVANRIRLGLLALLVAIATGTPASAQQQQKPNILFIMADDIGWMQVGVYSDGLGLAETPSQKYLKFQHQPMCVN
jgi:hypothetical protein